MRQISRSMSSSVSMPEASPARLSDWRIVKLAVWLAGYDRLLSFYVNARQAADWAKVNLSWSARCALRQRTRLIAALERREAEAPSHEITERVPAALSVLPKPVDLKIAVFIPGFLTGKGGAEKVAGRVAEALAKAGNRVDLVCRPPTSGEPPYPLDPQVRIRTLFDLDERQVAALKDEGYDLMIGFAMRGFYLSIASISRQLDVPFVIQECNNPTYIGMNLRQENWCRDARDTYWLRQAVCAHAVGVRLTVPDYAESVVSDVRPFTYAFYNAFAFPNQSSAASAGALDKKLICVGAMKNENKNGMAAVAAFCRFAARNPGWSLHLYGRNGFKKEMQALLERFPQAQVIDHGIVHDHDEIFGDAHAHLIPSHNEGLPSVVIEALAYGVPSIGFSDCDGVKHIIEDEETGFLLDRTDPDSLEKALGRIADAELRQQFSANALKFAEENLRSEQWEANWLRLVHNAVNRLDNQGQPKTPAGLDLAQGAQVWDELLETYLRFGSYLGSGPPSLGKAIVSPPVG